MSALARKMENLYWEIKVLPTMIDIKHLSKKVSKNPNYFNDLKEKEAKKEEKKLTKEQMKAARERAKEDSVDDISETVKKFVYDLSEGDSVLRISLITSACRAKELVDYALFYMTDENAQLIKHNRKEREIINGVASLFDFGKIYTSAGVCNLNFYDPECEDYKTSFKYILSIKDIEAKSKDPAFMESMKARKEQLLAESCSPEDDKPEEEAPSTIWTKDENGIIHPIFVPENAEEITNIFNPNEYKVQGIGITDEMFKTLEEKFLPILGNQKHRYEMFGDLVRLFILKDENTGLEEFFTIDPAIVMGKGLYCVLGKTQNDTLFVSTEHPNIVKNILSSAFYILYPEEIQEVINDYFRNTTIYRYIDMSNTQFMKGLDQDTFLKLGKKLSFILNLVKSENPDALELPRFRFNMWNGIDDFLLISDPAVKSPLVDIGETSSIISEGLMYEVKGDTVSRIYKGDRAEFNIDKYSEI